MPSQYPKWKFSPMRALFLILLMASLSACGFVGFPGVYRIDVEQGNIVTQEKADQLKHGMSRRQVRFILGTPLVEDSFNRDRWDYLYVKRNGLNVLDESLLTVVFVGDNLEEIHGDYLPEGWNGASDVGENAGEPDTSADAAAMDAMDSLENDKVGSDVIVTPVPGLAPPADEDMEQMDEAAPPPPGDEEA